jgi:hypothetical protein
MPYSKKIDLFCTVIAPLLLGVAIYSLKDHLHDFPVVINYLADGLWAYALVNCLLLIWHRQVNVTWITIGYLIAVSFEWMQYQEQLPGTGDIYDVVVYFICFGIGILQNRWMIKKIKQPVKTIPLS